MFIRFLLCFCLFSSFEFCENTSVQTQPFVNPKTEEELKAIAQELLDAVAPGNKEVWDKYLAESETRLFRKGSPRGIKIFVSEWMDECDVL